MRFSDRHCCRQWRKIPTDTGTSSTLPMPPCGIASSKFVVMLDLNRQLFAHPMSSWGPMMVRDSITEEIREIRHRLAEKFDNDVDRIGEDLRRRQDASGRRLVQLPKRPPRITVRAVKRKPPHKTTEEIL